MRQISDALHAYPAAVLAVLLSLGGCEQERPSGDAAAQAAPPAVGVARPLVKTIVEWDEYTARLQAVESVEVRARVSGYLESIHFKEGSVVEDGTLLFSIDPRPFEAELRRLEAELKQAQAAEENALAQFRRAQRLRAGKTMSEEEYQIRRTSRLASAADVDRARAALEAARLNLEFTQVRSSVKRTHQPTFRHRGQPGPWRYR